MSRRTEISIAIVGVIIALITLAFGDNIYQQVIGRSFGEDFRNFFSNQTKPATATSSPTLPKTTSTPDYGKLLYEENFEDGKANGLYPGAGDWNVVNDSDGNKVLTSTKSNDWSYMNFGPIKLSNGTVSYRVKINEDSGTNKYALAFLQFREMPNQLYLFAIDLTSDVGYIAYQGNGSSWDILGGEATGNKWERNIWYIVRIEFHGEQFKVYLNDDLFVNANDSRIKEGNLSFGVGVNTNVYFDDISVWSSNP